MPRSLRALLLLLPLLSLSCTTAAGLRRAQLRKGLDQAVISRSPGEIWPEVQRFLHDRGYPLAGDDLTAVGQPAQGMLGRLFSPGRQTLVRSDGSRVLETDLESRSRMRVRAEARPAPGGGSSLKLTMLKQSETNPAEYMESQDEELELALLERLDPVAAAQVQGLERPAVAGAPRDAWTPVRPLLGTWVGKGPGGAAVRWRFDFAGDGQFLELRGTPLRFAGPGAGAGPQEELGRISRGEGGTLTWRQFTAGGMVDQYQSQPARPEALVFLAAAPESLPGGRIRLTLGRDGDKEMLAILELAEAGKELAVAGEVRLHRE